MRLYKLMMKAAGSHAPAFRRSLFFTLLAVVAQAASYVLLIPLLAALSTPAISGIWLWLLLLSLIVVLEGIFRLQGMNFTWHHWHKVIGDNRLRLGEALYRMPLLELRQREAGDLAEVIGANVTVAAQALSSLATLFVQMLALPLVLIAAILVIDWRCGIIFLVAVTLMLPLLGRVRRQYQHETQAVDEADAASAARIVEYVQGLAVFKATGQAGSHSSRLNRVFDNQHKTQRTGHRSTASTIYLCQLISQLALVLLIALGGLLISRGEISIITLLALVAIAAHLIEPLGIIATMSKLFEMSAVALERIDELMRVPPLVQLAPSILPTSADIVFENVTFAYPQQQPILRNLSLRLAAGSFTGVVGPSGGGKTTLTLLINRLADPQQGKITLGGVDIRSLTQQQLSQKVTVVYQDVWLFNDSIRANILMGRPTASEAEMVDIAKAANIYDFICQLPKGFDTEIGELGSMLSGGERQRLSIARAMMKDAPIVILDEPTASLDADSEYAVQQALESLVVGKTVIMVAHRLHTLTGADRILFIDEGGIVEQGTHQQLLESRQRYYQLWMALQRGD